jgi:STE24 endopeptidase
VPTSLALAFWVLGGSRALADFASGASGGSAGAADALYITLFALLFASLTLPIGFYAGHVREKRWGMSNRRAREFAWEAAKSVALATVLALVLLVPFFYIVRHVAAWWAVVAALYAGYLLFSTSVLPNLLMPLFHKLDPLNDDALRDALVEVAEKAQFKPVRSVVVMRESAKSPRANAFIHGLGRTRRIVLFDTLLREFHPREIRFIVAHETAHLAHRDVPKFLALAVAIVFPEMWLLSQVLESAGTLFATHGAGDPAVLPLLLAFIVVFGFVDRMCFSWLSRRSEASADQFALETTRDPVAGESMLKRLCDRNLVDDQPHPWLERLFYSHPAPHRRIEAARQFR